ncbi:hypothetical protein C9975_03625 [Thalassospira xiamenensis]|nr:hypothetical protein C9939_02735 [Pseudidiomarina aestuarii]PTC01137.1 hypothetical protein C9975_03625 [Thalassospira xiamenensis]
MELTYLPTDPKSGRYPYPRVQAIKLATLLLFFFENCQCHTINGFFLGFHGRFKFVQAMKKGRRNGDLFYQSCVLPWP